VIGLQYFLFNKKATNLVLLKPIFVISNTNTGITTRRRKYGTLLSLMIRKHLLYYGFALLFAFQLLAKKITAN
jgi:hypothetical protein